jgi:hypothetical protein
VTIAVERLTSEDGMDGIHYQYQHCDLRYVNHLRIPVEDGQLDSRHVGVGESVGLGTIYLRVERVVAHGHSGKDRRSVRHLVGNIVDCLSVMIARKMVVDSHEALLVPSS